MTAIIGRTKDGETVWYTGRAGRRFVSDDRREAYEYPSVEAARRRAKVLNFGTELHGIWFVACVGEAL